MTPGEQIVGWLRASAVPLSGEELARRLGCSRAAVWKQVAALRRHGWAITARHAIGYTLAETPDRLGPAELAPHLAGNWRRVEWHASLDSTQRVARELARAGAAEGTVVFAETQTAGRGRLGRQWHSPPGVNVYASVVLRPALAPAAAPQVALVAGLAVADAVRASGIDAQLKWPNDVVLATPAGLAKLAGILAEGRPQQGWAVLGIGLNVAVRLEQLPVELRGSAATLGRSAAEVEPALADLLVALTRWLERPELDTLAAWRARDALRGRAISWGTGRGRAQGIDGAGRLVVALAGGGRTTLDAGEVHLLQVG